MTLPADTLAALATARERVRRLLHPEAPIRWTEPYAGPEPETEYATDAEADAVADREFAQRMGWEG